MAPRRWMADPMRAALAHYGGGVSLCRCERIAAPSKAERGALIDSGAVDSKRDSAVPTHVLDADGAPTLFHYRSGGRATLPCHEPRGFWLGK